MESHDKGSANSRCPYFVFRLINNLTKMKCHCITNEKVTGGLLDMTNDIEKKTYVLDTSVLIDAPYAIFAFDENTVIIPDIVNKEMQALAAHSSGETRSNARDFGQLMDSLIRNGGSLTEGVPLGNGGLLMVKGDTTLSVVDTVVRSPDLRNAIVVTRNPFQRVAANTAGVRAEEFKSEAVIPDSGSNYSGRCKLYVASREMQLFAETGELTFAELKEYYAASTGNRALSDHYTPSENENIILANADRPDAATQLGTFISGKIRKLMFYDGKGTVFGAKPRNVGQHFMLNALLAPAEVLPLVIGIGPAGTGKTFLSVAAALAQTYECDRDKSYKRILITRPNAKMDDDIGYLKGSESEKITPLLRGFFDNVENLMPEGEGTVEELMGRKVIEAQALAYMRSRSIAKQFVIVDEAQNLTPTQVLSIITRIGNDSKLVLLGDPDQIDHPHLDRHTNGLVYAAERMKGSRICSQITFNDTECTRSPLAAEAIARLTPKGFSL